MNTWRDAAAVDHDTRSENVFDTFQRTWLEDSKSLHCGVVGS